MRLTVAEIAAFLGMSESGLRNVIQRRGIMAIGKRGRANLYDPREVIRHTGTRDRQFHPECPSHVGQ